MLTPPHPHHHTHTCTHTPCHLDMNERLTFRAVSTLRSGFIQISTPLIPPPPQPCLIHCQRFFTDIISGCKWIWMNWGCRGESGWWQWRSHGQNATLAAECCMWRDGNILNTPPPEPSRFNIERRGLWSGGGGNTHFYSRHLGCKIPPRKKKSPFKWDAFISAWPLKRREGSCHSNGGERATPLPPPPSSSSPSHCPIFPWATPTHSSSKHARTRGGFGGRHRREIGSLASLTRQRRHFYNHSGCTWGQEGVYNRASGLLWSGPRPGHTREEKKMFDSDQTLKRFSKYKNSWFIPSQSSEVTTTFK